jgi:hypothetical protein
VLSLTRAHNRRDPLKGFSAPADRLLVGQNHGAATRAARQKDLVPSMAKAQDVVRKVPVAEAPAATEAVPSEGDDELTWSDQQALGTAMVFLVNVAKPTLAKIAQQQGYNHAEHTEGWRLYRAATGEEQSLSVVFGKATAPVGDASAFMPTLRAIDAFENLWFPRTRAIIQRVVDEEHRERFEAAFFHDLSQQPLGPAVIGSVSTYLIRLVALETSDEPGARKVRDTLRNRGLTDAVVAGMKAQIASMTVLSPEASTAAPDPKALAKARAEQKRAVMALRAWYNDWATTLRTAYNRRQLIQLGFASAAQKRDDAPDDPAPPVA